MQSRQQPGEASATRPPPERWPGPSTPNISQLYNSQPYGITSHVGMTDGDKRILRCMQPHFTNSQGHKAAPIGTICAQMSNTVQNLLSPISVPHICQDVIRSTHHAVVNSEAAFQAENLTFVSSPSPCPASPLQPQAVTIPQPKKSRAIHTLQAVLVPAAKSLFPGSHALYGLWQMTSAPTD